MLLKKNIAIKSVYIVVVAALSREEALKIAKNMFFSSEGPVPFVERTEKNPMTMVVLEGDAVIESINSSDRL